MDGCSAERLDAGRAIARLAEDWPELSVNVEGAAHVIADARGFDAVVRNLLQNAVVHGGARRVTVRVDQRDPGNVRVTLADDGRGVAPELVDGLGQPFARSAQTGGTGIGLFVCRQLVARMNGAMRFVRPAPDERGFTVVLDLPGAR